MNLLNEGNNRKKQIMNVFEFLNFVSCKSYGATFLEALEPFMIANELRSLAPEVIQVKKKTYCY